MNTPKTEKPSFYIFNPDGSKQKDVIQAFLLKQTIYVEDCIKGSLFLTGKNQEYKLVLSPGLEGFFRRHSECFCIVSFQHRKSGFFAVAKKHIEKESTATRLRKAGYRVREA